MSDTVTIEFEPHEWRYYYDTVRLHVDGDENILLPMHGYPVSDKITFPKRINFGTCSVGDTLVKQVPIVCDVPLDFEYEIRVIRSSAAIHVTPMNGVLRGTSGRRETGGGERTSPSFHDEDASSVDAPHTHTHTHAHTHATTSPPSNHGALVTIRFEPTRLVTESAEIELHVSQFNFVPIRCTIVGSASPGFARDQAVAALETEMGLRERDVALARAAVRQAKSGGGAGGGDGFTRAQYNVERARRRLDASTSERDHGAMSGAAASGGEEDDGRSRAPSRTTTARRPSKGRLTSEAVINIQGVDVTGNKLRAHSIVQKLLLKKEQVENDAEAMMLQHAVSNVPSGGGGGGGGGGVGRVASRAGTSLLAKTAHMDSFTAWSAEGGMKALSRKSSLSRTDASSIDASHHHHHHHQDQEAKRRDSASTNLHRPGANFDGFVALALPSHLDDPLLGDGTKEALFKQQFVKVQDYIRIKATRNIPSIGEELMEEDEAQRLSRELLDVAHRAAEAKRLEDASRRKSLLRANQAVRPLVSTESTTTSSNKSKDKDKEETPPSFVLYENFDWMKRMLALERFRSAARLVLVRVRIKRRLDRIRAVGKAAKWQKDRVEAAAAELLARGAAAVAQPRSKPQKRGEPRPGEFRIDPDKLRIASLGVSWTTDMAASNTLALDMGTAEGYHHAPTLPLVVPFEYRVLGHDVESFEACVDYQPPRLDAPLLAGAPEEGTLAVLALPFGTAFALGELEPDGLSNHMNGGNVHARASASLEATSSNAHHQHAAPLPLLPHVASAPEATTAAAAHAHLYRPPQIASRYHDDVRFEHVDVAWGRDARFPLQPRLWPVAEVARAELLGESSCRALASAKAPTLVDMDWEPARRTTRWLHDGLLPPRPSLAVREAMLGPDPRDNLDGKESTHELGAAVVDLQPQAPSAADMGRFLPSSVASKAECRIDSAHVASAALQLLRTPQPSSEQLAELGALRRKMEMEALQEASVRVRQQLRDTARQRAARFNALVRQPTLAALDEV